MEPALAKWIEGGLVMVVTLTSHVKEAIFISWGWGLSWWESLPGGNELSNAMSMPVLWLQIEVFVPVFRPTNGSDDAMGGEQKDVSFAIQAGVTVNRGHLRVMNHLANLRNSSNSTLDKVSLNIIDSSGWEASVHASVPESVQDNIFFDNNLEYFDYYAHLSTKSALILASSKHDYIMTLFSSSIPAMGIPLVATRAMLKSYSYLREEDVYVREDGETELDEIKKVVQMLDEERRAKTKTVHAIRERMVRDNAKIVAGWIEDVRLKMGS